jgi:hypothetical protein
VFEILGMDVAAAQTELARSRRLLRQVRGEVDNSAYTRHSTSRNSPTLPGYSLGSATSASIWREVEASAGCLKNLCKGF